MSKFWFLCGDEGTIRYAGDFEDYESCDEFLFEEQTNAFWIFDGKPEIEDES